MGRGDSPTPAWNEYYDARYGWAIPSADSAGDGAERDALEAASLYDLLEHQIAPRQSPLGVAERVVVGRPPDHRDADLAQ